MRPASVKIGATAADQFARLVKGFDPFRRLAKTSRTDHRLQHADGDVIADDRASKPVKSDMLFDSDEAREVVAIFKHSFDPVLEKRFCGRAVRWREDAAGTVAMQYGSGMSGKLICIKID
jgi:hypothetical protein